MNLTRDHLSPYIEGSLECSGIAHVRKELNRAIGVYRRVLGNGYYHLPFFLVADLLVLLEQGCEVRFRSENEWNRDSDGPGEDLKLVMRYERECLGRILQSADVNSAMEIALTSPHPARVTERLLFQILRTLGPHYPKGFFLNPGLLRDFVFSEPVEPSEFDFHGSLENFLEGLNANVNWNQLLFEEDVFELTHLEALGTDHLRIGCRQILEVSRRLQSPENLQLDLAREDGADTAFLDETHYPTGGLSGLTNRGSFENLLSSELVYLDEGAKDVSLFELRYAEGELLYYLRDSGNLRRKRRSIHFIFDVGDIFESKLPGYRWQYSVLLQGLCLRLLHDLFGIFEMDALRFHFHYIVSEDRSIEGREFFEGEIGVMKTVLADYAKHGWVTFATGDSVGPESLIDPARKTYAVILSGPASGENWSNEIDRIGREDLPIQVALLEADTASSGGPGICLPRAGLSVDEIREAKNALLAKLVS